MPGGAPARRLPGRPPAKNAAGGCDGVRVAGAVGPGVVSIQGLHFDTDPWSGLSSPPARSAVNVEPGATHVVAIGNFWKANGYGAGPTVGALRAASAGNVAVLAAPRTVTAERDRSGKQRPPPCSRARHGAMLSWSMVAPTAKETRR